MAKLMSKPLELAREVALAEKISWCTAVVGAGDGDEILAALDLVDRPASAAFARFQALAGDEARDRDSFASFPARWPRREPGRFGRSRSRHRCSDRHRRQFGEPNPAGEREMPGETRITGCCSGSTGSVLDQRSRSALRGTLHCGAPNTFCGGPTRSHGSPNVAAADHGSLVLAFLGAGPGTVLHGGPRTSSASILRKILDPELLLRPLAFFRELRFPTANSTGGSFRKRSSAARRIRSDGPVCRPKALADMGEDRSCRLWRSGRSRP